MNTPLKIILWTIVVVVVIFAFIASNLPYFVDAAPSFLRVLATGIWYIFVPVQGAFLPSVLYKSNNKKLLIVTGLALVLRPIFQYFYNPLVPINQLANFIFPENLSRFYHVIFSYIVAVLTVGYFSTLLNRLLD
ncbi:hypothetical protein SAMN05421780_1233 [Flexibacter flexilis DSM 6793]|uniref:Uncharacterized protein n=1 Tax=Flexibacter flexilis DSM 6793 TaxID=927664 RepID=A0A1I1NWV8_9BACT|nr:hypothetical protein [Flexibacter flexilis]SFD02079.1 hypothetical protein SAMN05421780_1233 [Flexibacter flexilis DSM 6793]